MCNFLSYDSFHMQVPMTISIFSGFSYCMLLMMQWPLIISCFSTLFPISSSSFIAPIQHKCNSAELAALLHFKQEFQTNTCHNVSYDASAYPKTSTWNNNSLQWDGIHCDPQTGHVIGIDLSSSCLYGPINSNSTLFSLLHLQYLNLAYNLFGYSSIPLEFGNLSRLVYLNMSVSGFVGSIPIEISKLSKLSLLDLSSNELQGKFPANIFHLQNLQLLNIENNNALKGYLPEFNSTTSRLETLQLYGTNFTGNIPSSIENLSSLRKLDLSYCKFSGTPPSSLGNLTKLIFLDLSANNFAVSNSMSWLNKLTPLKYLYLHHINLEGGIPSSLANFSRLSVLYLYSNNLNGVIPSWLGNLTQLYDLDLSYSSLRGSIPNSLLTLPDITYLTLSNNYLSGPLEINLFFQLEHLNLLSFGYNNLTIISRESSGSNFKRSSLYFLDISNNTLQGSFPIPPPSVQFYAAEYVEPITGMLELSPKVCTLTSLTILDFRNSHLTGEVPGCFENLSLQVLDLQNNNLHGSIPKLCSKMFQLRVISLNHNNFRGKLPRSLASCSNLKFLDVGNNYINDTFPSWLGSPHLRVLVLRANAFHGSIGILQDKNAKFSRLRIIDLSMNNFSGNLSSRYFQAFDAMKSADLSRSTNTYMMELTDLSGSNIYTYSVTLADKGMELEFLTISDALIAIDLSQNRFHGTIPRILGNLTGLHLLNLSNNHLTGPIPSSLAKLEQLQSLDLSSNRLSGEIPQQLSQLPFVSVFNVSYNYLTGLIPEGRQFDTFENISYLGNLRLCGKPLSRSCRNSATPNHEGGTEMEKQNNRKLLLSTEHLVALIGFVGGLVFGVAMEDIIDWRRLIQSWIQKIRWSLRRN